MSHGSFIFENSLLGSEASCYFLDPIAEIKTFRLSEVEACLRQMEDWQAKGFYLAGYLAYEAGYAWHPVVDQETWDFPLLRFEVFREKRAGLPAESDRILETLPLVDASAAMNENIFAEKIAAIHQELSQGNSYQINFTFRESFVAPGTAQDLYSQLRRRQKTSWTAFLAWPDETILSFSPEMFLKKEGLVLRTQPMKGTAPRSPDRDRDLANRDFLPRDEKSRAENLMIVDLLRNDLGRLAKPGSVVVENLFEVMTLETAHQMVSTIRAELSPSASLLEIFRSLFPCGSITGAPKRKSMEIISQLEDSPRGVYTGAIGFIEPNGDFSMNVAIRTLRESRGRWSYGVGGGILIDSNPHDEYQECQTKTRFLKEQNDFFQLIETLRFERGLFLRLDHHLQRLEMSARYFGFPFDRKALEKTFAEVRSTGQPYKARLTLDHRGETQLCLNPLTELPSSPRVQVHSESIHSLRLFQHHKTTQRHFYDREFEEAQKKGLYDWIFLNERQELVEGTRHNLFLRHGSQWSTPSLDSGALPGIQRRIFLQEKSAQERVLTLQDLRSADEVCLTNSVRGVVRVEVEL